MAKQPTPAPASKETPVDLALVTTDMQAANSLAALERSTSENVMVLATQLGYDGALTVGALEDGIRFYQQRTAEACLELGKRLVLLKEASLYGEFQNRLELLGIDDRAARRFMAAATRFSKRVTSPVLKIAQSQSKLLELLVLDDEEMAELAEGGTVRGMSADAVASMGVRELRASLREHMAEKDATDKLLAAKDAKINKLTRHIAKATPDDVLAELHQEAAALLRNAQGAVAGELRQALIALQNHKGAEQNVFMAGLVGQLQADLTALREEFNLPDVSTAADQALAGEVSEWAGR
ncbi:hypothetical protein [Rhodoferax aquaticus]|uniref:DUF3102 domain-containing protein n=1 Tax=Rhodoferax aquaticus TaxID=2527691 RepID=A0A515ERQ0_9BURK|nr:hypothetical protein [Rhodoferax aquaticus]QDL55318.1 hypothetical protein EXZ61_14705 [Rhodoferax aquaticus]